MSFVVTGLPRSRTAWLSAFLTGDGAYCLHEGLLLGEVELIDWLNSSDMHGDSDSALPLVWDRILAGVASPPRVVVVVRGREEVISSLGKYWKGIDFLAGKDPRPLIDQIEAKLAELSKTALVVEYDKLSDLGTLKKIWEHCLPSLPFNPLRATLLNNLNILQCTKSFNHS